MFFSRSVDLNLLDASRSLYHAPRLQTSQDSRYTYGSGSVGDAVEGQLSGCWADGGVGSVDLSGVDDGTVGVSSGSGGGCKSNDGGDGVLHFDGWYYLLKK
jgi:hypothetical protein